MGVRRPGGYGRSSQKGSSSGFQQAGAVTICVHVCYGWRVMIDAILSQDVQRVRAALAGCRDINAKTTGMGGTILMYAAIYGSSEIVNALLDAGADIHATDENGKSALLHAFTSRRWDRNKIIEVLIKRGADVMVRDRGVARFGSGVGMTRPGESVLRKVRKELAGLDPVRSSSSYRELKEIEVLLVNRGVVE